VVTRYRIHLGDLHLAPGTINVRLAAVRRDQRNWELGLNRFLSPATRRRRCQGLSV
jgi:hypothetical protein